MSKKMLAWLTVLGTILVVLSSIVMIIGAAEDSLALTALPEIVLLPAIVLLIIAWIGMMVAQAKRGQWGWFVCTLLFGWPTMVLYLIIVPEMTQTFQSNYAAPYSPVPPYQSYQQPMSLDQPYQPPAPPYQPYPPLNNSSEERRW
jgi:hypothetical protein